MKDNRKEFVFVIGKSENLDRDKMIEGFNKIVETQKKGKDESLFTLVFFNDEYKVSANGKSIKEMRKYNARNYTPKGRSALWDAIGATMDMVGERLSNTADSEMPCQICMVIIGEKDNASTVYDHARLDEMIKVQKYIYKWDFVMYSNDAVFDINKGGNLENTEKMFEDINNYITSIR